MNIIQAIKDQNLFRPFLGDLSTWKNWLALLRVVYGLPVYQSYHPLIRECTGRDPSKLPKQGFDTSLFLTGRRSGKSRISAVMGVFEALLAGHEKKLDKGEKGLVVIIAPVKSQTRIIKRYVSALLKVTPMLENEVIGETKTTIELKNGIDIEILAGDWRTVRGYTLVSAIIDEACFFGVDDSTLRIKNDKELIAALRPALATTEGRLIAISSPYAKRGWCYSTWQKNFGIDNGNTLVWKCPSRTMNPLLSQSVIDEALNDDYAKARSEFYADWRDDIAIFLPPEVIQECVVKERIELLNRPDKRYFAFCDMSGGRSDSATLAIAHKQDRMIVVDSLREWKPPFSPQIVINQMSDHLKKYGIKKVVGDNYSAEFVVSAFSTQGIRYRKSDKNKSQLYLELLPMICSQEIELPDNETLIKQLANLERRTRSGGRDTIDHPPGGHDDLANAIAGISGTASMKLTVVGGLEALNY